MNAENLEVHPLHEAQLPDNARKLLTEIRFDCLVKMYYYGSKQTSGGMFQQPKSLPPQWFILSETLTLDFIRTESEGAIGYAFKQMYKKLEEHIKQYEKSK